MLLCFLLTWAELVTDTFNNNGVTFRFCKSAQSKPVKILCLPGAMMFLERAKPFWEALDNAGFEVYGLEYRDHGASSVRLASKNKLKLDTDDFDVYTQDVHRFVKAHLQDKKFVILGSSLGGHLALKYMKDYGDDQIQHAVLVAPMVDVISPFKFLPRTLLKSAVKLLSWIKSPQGCALGFDDKTPEDVIRREKDAVCQKILSAHKDKIMPRLSLGWVDAALRSIDDVYEADQFNVPMTVFLGKRENIVDNQSALAFLQSKAPKSTFHFLNSSHRVIDQHLDEVVEEIYRAVSLG